MILTTAIAFVVVWRLWQWPLWQAATVMVPLFLLEQAFFVANSIKIVEGGWFPLLVAGKGFVAMLTWRRGALELTRQTRQNEVPLRLLGGKLAPDKKLFRVPATAVFLTSDDLSAPN